MTKTFTPLCILLLFFVMTGMASYAQLRNDLWKKVEESKSKGLPQTAIEHL
jgi:hypothetical protein